MPDNLLHRRRHSARRLVRWGAVCGAMLVVLVGVVMYGAMRFPRSRLWLSPAGQRTGSVAQLLFAVDAGGVDGFRVGPGSLAGAQSASCISVFQVSPFPASKGWFVPHEWRFALDATALWGRSLSEYEPEQGLAVRRRIAAEVVALRPECAEWAALFQAGAGTGSRVDVRWLAADVGCVIASGVLCVSGVMTIVWWRRRARLTKLIEEKRAAGTCERCGYPVRARGGIGPECGMKE